MSILIDLLDKTMDYIASWRQETLAKTKKESKQLIDKSIAELDDNLRKQWPRKGRLEVEIFQERKSQITAHIKKYER